MLATLCATYQRPRAWLTTLVVASIAFVITILAQQWATLGTFWGILPTFADKIQFTWYLLGNFGTSLTLLGQIGTLTIVLLLGINITLLARYITDRRGTRTSSSHQSHSSRSLGGIVAGIFGIGCAACGTALLGALLSLFGATSILALLPLHGQELTLLSVGILLWACWHLLREMAKPLVCEPDRTTG